MFSKILIANRGEIAVRIIRACKEMGIATVSVYSEADRHSLHAALSDESFCIGEAESYLNEKAIISAALISGAQAIHPGYGFLSENAHFAKLCRKNGIVFIGPEPESMEKLSDKASLKELMKDAGLDVILGESEINCTEDIKKAAEVLKYPLMLKARAGGGGRGIRLIKDEGDIEEAFFQASNEASGAFGDKSLYLEKFISPARHIELQMLSDEFGNAVCLGERDCSIQRRNQKLIEETPSPGVSHKKRQKLIGSAVKAIKKIGYKGAGTLEFLMDESGHFWFMEMNVRLQVEHCVTEMLTGIDIVKWQIRIAAGMPLSFSQDSISLDGAAIECRINARACGNIKFLHIPGGPSLRFDSHLLSGMTIFPYYDSLLGKLVVFSKSREEALRKLRAALCELVIDGIPTNIEEQLQIVESEAFSNGNYNLSFMGGR